MINGAPEAVGRVARVGRAGPSKTRSLAVAGVGAMFSNAAMLGIFWRANMEIPTSYLASHFLIILIVHALLAVTLSDRMNDRPWAVALFAVPVTLSLWPTAERIGGAAGILALSAAAAVASALWSRLLRTPGAPLVSGTCGTLLGAALLMFRSGNAAGLGADVITLGAYGAVAMLLGGMGLFLSTPAVRGETAQLRVFAAALVVTVVGYLAVDSRAVAVPAPPIVAASTPQPPVVLIVLDTLRTDHLRSNGYGKEIMPRLEQFAAANMVSARRGVSTSSWSLPAHGSMFTGHYPPRHGAHKSYVDEERPPDAIYYSLRQDVPTLAELLGEVGYWTVGLSANYAVMTPFGLARGFDHFVATSRACHRLRKHTPWQVGTDEVQPLAWLDRLPPFNDCGFFGIADRYRTAEEITDDAIEALRQSDGQSLFLFLNYFDAHEPHHDRNRRFGKRYYTSRETLEASWGGEQVLDERREAELIELYDSELTYLDIQLERFLGELATHEMWDETMLIITSDHGESLGQRGLIGHGSLPYEEQIRVPFFFKPAGDNSPMAAGGRQNPPGIDLVQSVDILPTVLQHVGVEIPEGLDGVPWGVGRTMARSWVFVNRDMAAHDAARFGREAQTVEQGEWKLIAYSSGEKELYNLLADPLEARNLADQRPDVTAMLTSLLWDREWYADPARSGGEGLDPELLDKLRSLGYIR